MRKYLVVLCLLPIFFLGCDNTNSSSSGGSGLSGGKLTIKVEDYDDYDYLDEVKAFIVNLKEDEREIADSDFKKSFTLNLPDEVSKSRLSSIEDYAEMLAYECEIDADDIKISAKDANLGELCIYGYSKGKRMGEFYLYKETKDSDIEAYYVYVDKSVKATYSDKYIKINLDFKKGWNLVYFTEKDDGLEISTKSVSGMIWDFREDEGGGGGGGGGNKTAIKFVKLVNHSYFQGLSVYNQYKTELAAYEFGTGTGESKYFDIPPGKHIPCVLIKNHPSYEDAWYSLEWPGDVETFDFIAGQKYSFIISSDGIGMKNDGAYSKTNIISKKFVSKRKNNIDYEGAIKENEFKKY